MKGRVLRKGRYVKILFDNSCCGWQVFCLDFSAKVGANRRLK